jgi:hypothetical protein
MNKKINTLFFILGATLFNILMTVISFLLLFYLYSRILVSRLPDEAFVWGSIFVFIGAIVLSFFVYQALLKLLIKKVDIHKYFDPIFNPKRR